MRKKKKESWFCKKNIVGLFFIVIMVFSVLGLWQGGSTPTVSYNDYKFKMDGNYYTTKIDNHEVSFHYMPESVEDIELDQEVVDLLNNAGIIYVLFNPNDKLIETIEVVRMEMAIGDFPTLLNKQVLMVLSEESDLYPNLDVLSCANATTTSPMINFRYSNVSQIFMEGSCVVIEASSHLDLYAYKDRLLYGLYGVI